MASLVITCWRENAVGFTAWDDRQPPQGRMVIIPAIARVEPWPREAMASPTSWLGDLDDDCTAEWAGLTLRAEQMDRKHWWWAVYDSATNEAIADSHGCSEISRNGKRARNAAKLAARKWLTEQFPSDSGERTSDA
jgi:hypothetical protein